MGKDPYQHSGLIQTFFWTRPGKSPGGMRKNSPKLKEAADQFLRTHKQGTAFGNAVIGRYAHSDKMLKNAIAPDEG